MATTNKTATVDGLISLGHEQEDYCGPLPAEGEARPKKTVCPTFRVCGKAAVELHKALTSSKILGGKFAAIVVLKNNMVRVSDGDEDEDESEDVELEFTIEALMPHVEADDDEAKIMAEFEQLPAAVKDASGESDEKD